MKQIELEEINNAVKYLLNNPSVTEIITLDSQKSWVV